MPAPQLRGGHFTAMQKAAPFHSGKGQLFYAFLCSAQADAHEKWQKWNPEHGFFDWAQVAIHVHQETGEYYYSTLNLGRA